MIRSFDYAAQSVLLGMTRGRDVPPGRIRTEDQPTLEPWAWAWYEQIARDYFGAYLAASSDDGLLPRTEQARVDLLELLILEKALAEVDAELEHRPEWAIIPLRNVVRLLATDPEDPLFCPECDGCAIMNPPRWGRAPRVRFNWGTVFFRSRGGLTCRGMRAGQLPPRKW